MNGKEVIEVLNYLFDLELNVSLKEIFGVCPIEMMYLLVECRKVDINE